MIEKFEDLELNKLNEIKDQKEVYEEIDRIIKEKLDLSLDHLKQSLADYTLSHAEELTLEFTNIAPLGDYSKLLEDNDSMASFLKSEGYKSEHWNLVGIKLSDLHKTLVSFDFTNKAVDDGDVFKGFVFVSFNGKIKHAFSQGELSE